MFVRVLDTTEEGLLWTVRGSPPALMMTRLSASGPGWGSVKIACVAPLITVGWDVTLIALGPR